DVSRLGGETRDPPQVCDGVVAFLICPFPAPNDPEAALARLIKPATRRRETRQVSLRIDLHGGEANTAREDIGGMELGPGLLEAAAMEHDAAEHAVGHSLGVRVARRTVKDLLA